MNEETVIDGFERRKEQSRESIRQAAVGLFLEHGVKKTGIKDIAGKAGVSQVTIYNLFGSKDNLICDCLEVIIKRLIEQMREVTKLDKPYREKLEDVIVFVINIKESYPELRVVDILNNPRLRLLKDSFLEGQRRIFLDFIKEGQQQGYLNPVFSEESITNYLDVMIQGVVSNPEIRARMRYNRQLLHDLILISLYGFAK